MNRENTAIKKKRGFTLTEVLTTLTLFSILVPGALLMSLHLSGRAHEGVNRNSAAAGARYFQQFFIKKINASGINIRCLDGGNIAVLEMYNETAGKWEDAALTYLEEQKALVYFPPTFEAEPGKYQLIAKPVYKNGNRPVFAPSKKSASLECNLYFGNQPPDSLEKIGGIVLPQGVFVEITASPRNAGQFGTTGSGNENNKNK